MDHPSFINQVHVLVGRLSVHQDFFWFFSLLGWSFALIAWWRHPRRGPAWPWLPWCAGAAIASAFIQFGMFNPTFDLFQERLIPGTVADYRHAVIDPYWLGDILLALAVAVMAAGWGWLALARSRWFRFRALPAVLLAGVFVHHVATPETGGGLLALLGVMAATALWLKSTPTPWSRLGLAGAALLPALSTIGPLAAALGQLQRAGPPAPVGLAAAVFQMLLGGAVFAGLLHEIFAFKTAGAGRIRWSELRPFVLGGCLLLGTVMFIGIQNGRDNRREIQQNRLRTTAAHASVFDPALLAPLQSPAFRIQTRSAAGESIAARSAGLARGSAEPARQRLIEVVRATPFLKAARLVVLHDGWLVAAISSDNPAGSIELLRRATPEDVARWTNREAYVEESPVREIGAEYFCRAPILAADGRMLGWLDCVRSEYYLSVERRWRAAPFVMADFGLVLLALVFVQRRAARERETAQRAAAVAGESLRVKTAFLANVSHELRTPLQNILGYSELLRQEQGDNPSARLDALRQQGELMTRLVNDLIDLSAVESGSFQLAARPVAPADLVRQTVESLRPRAEAKGLSLRCATADDVPAWVTADSDRLRQVLINLAGNALKFTDQGTVMVSLRAEPAPEGRSRLILTVDDTGPGIPPEQQGRLFAPFTRLARTAEKEGSGLGLALSAALCRAMGGGLVVESDGRSGSRFTASFVLTPAAAPASVQLVVRPAAGFAPRVLVVDDNRLVRELFVAALTERGAACRPAANGAEALVRLAGEVPEVIVLDLALPDGDGADLTPRLRALAPGVRIIGVSAHAGIADRTRALAAGMDHFLTKPVPLDELWAAVVGARTGAAGPAAYFDPPPALRERLHRDFLAELPARRAELATAMRAGNWRQVRAGAHYLRNSALVVQATELFEACTGLENAAAAGQAAEAGRWWSRCAAALDVLAAGK